MYSIRNHERENVATYHNTITEKAAYFCRRRIGNIAIFPNMSSSIEKVSW